MKSSCSARGLSMSQNLPEIALILLAYLSLFHYTLLLLFALFILVHPSTPPLSLHFTPLICIHLSAFPLSSAVSISASVWFLSYCLLLVWLSLNWSVITTVSVNILLSRGLSFLLFVTVVKYQLFLSVLHLTMFFSYSVTFHYGYFLSHGNLFIS